MSFVLDLGGIEVWGSSRPSAGLARHVTSGDSLSLTGQFSCESEKESSDRSNTLNQIVHTKAGEESSDNQSYLLIICYVT